MDSEVGVLTALWRYPVKSLRGERLERLELDGRGVVGDRIWALVDRDGKLASGKDSRRFRKVRGLMQHAARQDGESAVIVMASGEEVAANDPRSAEAARELAGDGWRLAREGAVPHHDAGALHLVTTATLASLAEAAGHPVEADRLRPNLLVELDDAATHGPFPEDAWLGRELVVGGARLRAVERTERCVMTTHPQAGLPPRRRLLQVIGRANEVCAGIYLDVLEPGPIRVGDRIRLREST